MKMIKIGDEEEKKMGLNQIHYNSLGVGRRTGGKVPMHK